MCGGEGAPSSPKLSRSSPHPRLCRPARDGSRAAVRRSPTPASVPWRRAPTHLRLSCALHYTPCRRRLAGPLSVERVKGLARPVGSPDAVKSFRGNVTFAARTPALPVSTGCGPCRTCPLPPTSSAPPLAHPRLSAPARVRPGVQQAEASLETASRRASTTARHRLRSACPTLVPTESSCFPMTTPVLVLAHPCVAGSRHAGPSRGPEQLPGSVFMRVLLLLRVSCPTPPPRSRPGLVSASATTDPRCPVLPTLQPRMVELSPTYSPETLRHKAGRRTSTQSTSLASTPSEEDSVEEAVAAAVPAVPAALPGRRRPEAFHRVRVDCAIRASISARASRTARAAAASHAAPLCPPPRPPHTSAFTRCSVLSFASTPGSTSLRRGT